MSTLKTERVESLDGLYGIDTKDIQPIGVGQTWQDMLSVRAKDVTYTNDTGKPIYVFVTTTDTTARTLKVNNVIVGYIPTLNNQLGAYAIVPNGSSYVFDGNPVTWSELR